MDNKQCAQRALIYTLLVACLCSRISAAISSKVENNVQNAISEEDRRGATIPHDTKTSSTTDGKKSTRFAHHSANSKQQSYFYPSGYDSHIAATGAAAGYGATGSAFEYGGSTHHTAPTSLGTHHTHYPHHHHHSAPSAYASGYGGYGFGHSAHGGGHHGYGLYGGGGHGHALGLKGLLIPLAGIALLGAAAALTTNPVLLQLGVVNGRRRRSADDSYPANPYVRPQSDN